MARKSKKAEPLPPWGAHMQMLKSFFKGDGRIVVEDGTERGVVTDSKTGKSLKGNWVVGGILVNDADCCIALRQVLRRRVEFGNVGLAIDVVAANEQVQAKIDKKLKAGKKFTKSEALKEVLKKNPAFVKLRTDRAGDRILSACIFNPKVIQWCNGDLRSPWKLATCTHEVIAGRVFADGLGVQFCSEPVAEPAEDPTSVSIFASMASGKWVVTGVAVEEVVKTKQFDELLTSVRKFLEARLSIDVEGEGKGAA